MASNSQWMQWSRAPWLSLPENGGETIQLCERLLQFAADIPFAVTYTGLLLFWLIVGGSGANS